jgi:hypothetical protein
MSVKSENAKRRREVLREKLGGVCSMCGTRLDLQFDFIKSDGGKHHALSSVDRVRAYEIEFGRGNLQLLCGQHNREKGNEFKNFRKLNAAFSGIAAGSRLAPFVLPSRT